MRVYAVHCDEIEINSNFFGFYLFGMRIYICRYTSNCAKCDFYQNVNKISMEQESMYQEIGFMLNLKSVFLTSTEIRDYGLL